MKSLEVLEVSTKIGVGVGVGTAVCIATLKGAMHLCDACYKAGKKLQNEIIKKQAEDLHVFGEDKEEQESDDPDDTNEDQQESADPEETRHEEAMKILDDALGSDESSEA